MAKIPKPVHVVPGFDGGWAAKKEGSLRVTKRFGTKEEALDWAVKEARKRETELVIHGRDGTIRESDSYGRDPNPPRDHSVSRVRSKDGVSRARSKDGVSRDSKNSPAPPRDRKH